MQFLDQEIQAFADFAAFGCQTLDLIEVGVQSRQFFGHVDTDGKRRGLGQCTVLCCFGQGGAFAQSQGFFPALQKTLALLLHQLGHQRQRLAGQNPQLHHTVDQHCGQPSALTLPG